MSSMNVDPNPSAWIEKSRSAAQQANQHDVVASINKMDHLYDRKLWHQLSIELDSFSLLPSSQSYLIQFYDLFVRDFEQKLNKLSLVAGIGSAVARLLPNNATRIEFLTALADRVKPAPPKADEEHLYVFDMEATSAYLLATTQAAYYQLLDRQYETVLKHINSSEKQLDALDRVDPRVSSAFYRVAADYYKEKSFYAKFYKTSLLFLACLGDIDEITTSEAASRAYDLGLAALLSDEIYNFGELLMHPILDKLNGTPNEWLKALLFAFNAGDISGFEKQSQSLPEPLLVQNMGMLRMKICLMALIDFVFRRGTTTSRAIPFAAIANHTRLPHGEVEHLVMKALALNLVKGSMDQVNATVTFSWVTPRVLNKQQIQTMIDLLDAWKVKVNSLTEKFKEDGAELFTSA